MSLSRSSLSLTANSYFWVGFAALLLSALLIFPRLGHYALWDDEAYTGLLGKSVIRNGDMTAFVDDNLIASYANGGMFRDLKERVTPPLSTWIAALSMKVFGETSFGARFPSAVLGLLTLLVLLVWMKQRRLPLALYAASTLR